MFSQYIRDIRPEAISDDTFLFESISGFQNNVVKLFIVLLLKMIAIHCGEHAKSMKDFGDQLV